MGLDALVIPRETVLSARLRINELCGIDPAAVMIAASHSHSSGPTGMVQPGQYRHADGFVQQLADRHSSCADAGYLKLVEDRIVRAVCQADAGRSAAVCGVGVGTEHEAAYNRPLPDEERV